MLELRYAGCSDCLITAKSVLRNAGFFVNKDYKIEFHQDHRGDRIYQKRPDYLDISSGAILYNPATEAWIDFYSSDRLKCILCSNPTEATAKLVRELSQ